MLPAVGAVLSTSPPVTVAAPAPAVTLAAGTDDTPGTATLDLSGTVQLPAGPVGSVTIPFRFSVSFTITPSADMNDTTRVCTVAATAPASLTTTAAEPLGSLFALAAQTLTPMLTGGVFEFLQDSVLNPAVLAAVAAAFGLPELPAGGGGVDAQHRGRPYRGQMLPCSWCLGWPVREASVLPLTRTASSGL